MPQFRCRRIPNKCERCGECCRFDSPLTLTPSEEKTIKKRLFEETGFLYIYPFSRFGLGIQTYEYGKAKELARKKRVKLKILPKKIVYDSRSNKAIVFDWFLDHKVCPFLSEGNECLIYKERFELCRLFPETLKKLPEVEKRLSLVSKMKSKGVISIKGNKGYAEIITAAKKAKLENLDSFLGLSSAESKAKD